MLTISADHFECSPAADVISEISRSGRLAAGTLEQRLDDLETSKTERQ